MSYHWTVKLREDQIDTLIRCLKRCKAECPATDLPHTLAGQRIEDVLGEIISIAGDVTEPQPAKPLPNKRSA